MSSQPTKELTIDQQIVVAQIIKFGLVSGVLGFAAYIFFVAREPSQPDESLLVWLFAGFGGLMAVARLVVPQLVERAAMQKLVVGRWQPPNPDMPPPSCDEGRLVGVYLTQMIVGSALIEAGAFANLFMCLLTGHPVSWIVSAGMLLGLAMDFPTRGSVHRWIEAKMTLLRDERSLAGRPS